VSSDSSKLKYWNMLKSSTYCTFVEPSPAVFLTLSLRDQSFTDMRLLNCTAIELGKRGLGRLILNTRAHESDQGCWAPVPGRRPSPIQVAKRVGMYAATLLSAKHSTQRNGPSCGSTSAPASASGCCCPSCCSVSFLAA